MITIDYCRYKEHFNFLLGKLSPEVRKVRWLTCQELSGLMETWCRQNYPLGKDALKSHKPFKEEMKALLDKALNETEFEF